MVSVLKKPWDLELLLVRYYGTHGHEHSCREKVGFHRHEKLDSQPVISDLEGRTRAIHELKEKV